MLAFGDPIASAIGYRWGRYRFKNGKSLVGSLAFLLASWTVLTIYLATFAAMPVPEWLLLAAVMGLAGAMVEVLVDKIDDNFTIPVASTLAGMAVIALLA